MDETQVTRRETGAVLSQLARERWKQGQRRDTRLCLRVRNAAVVTKLDLNRQFAAVEVDVAPAQSQRLRDAKRGNAQQARTGLKTSPRAPRSDSISVAER